MYVYPAIKAVWTTKGTDYSLQKGLRLLQNTESYLSLIQCNTRPVLSGINDSKNWPLHWSPNMSLLRIIECLFEGFDNFFLDIYFSHPSSAKAYFDFTNAKCHFYWLGLLTEFILHWFMYSWPLHDRLQP